MSGWQDSRCAFANGCKDDWDRQLPLAVFAINNAASTLGDRLTPFFIGDRGAHPRLPLSAPPADGDPGETPAGYAHRMRELLRLWSLSLLTHSLWSLSLLAQPADP